MKLPQLSRVSPRAGTLRNPRTTQTASSRKAGGDQYRSEQHKALTAQPARAPRALRASPKQPTRLPISGGALSQVEAFLSALGHDQGLLELRLIAQAPYTDREQRFAPNR